MKKYIIEETFDIVKGFYTVQYVIDADSPGEAEDAATNNDPEPSDTRYDIQHGVFTERTIEEVKS